MILYPEEVASTQTFSVYVKNNSLDVSVVCLVWMDGCLVRQFGCSSQSSKHVHGAYTSQGRRKFQFAKADAQAQVPGTPEISELVRTCADTSISDGELAIVDFDKSAAFGAITVGTIEVQLFRCVILRKNLPHRARSIQMDDKTIPKSSTAEGHRVV